MAFFHFVHNLTECCCFLLSSRQGFRSSVWRSKFGRCCFRRFVLKIKFHVLAALSESGVKYFTNLQTYRTWLNLLLLCWCFKFWSIFRLLRCSTSWALPIQFNIIMSFQVYAEKKYKVNICEQILLFL